MSMNRRDVLKGCIGVLGAAATAAVAKYSAAAEVLEKKAGKRLVEVKNVEMRAGRAVGTPRVPFAPHVPLDFPGDRQPWETGNVLPYGAPEKYRDSYGRFSSLDTEAILADMKKRNHQLWMNHRGEIKKMSERIDWHKANPTEWEKSCHSVSNNNKHAGWHEWVQSPEHSDLWANYNYDETWAGKRKVQREQLKNPPYSKDILDKEEALAKMAVKTPVGWWTHGY
jgi:hypothetical protein